VVFDPDIVDVFSDSLETASSCCFNSVIFPRQLFGIPPLGRRSGEHVSSLSEDDADAHAAWGEKTGPTLGEMVD